MSFSPSKTLPQDQKQMFVIFMEKVCPHKRMARKSLKILPFSKIPKKSDLAISFLCMSSLHYYVSENPGKSDC